nr:uncharacterized protein LOC113403492 isoform X1 [Vanessa tameamea]
MNYNCGDGLPPSSEVGSALDQNNETNIWRAMFEQQNQNMRALIEALQSSKPAHHEELPAFDPEKKDADARSWCATADLCFAENPPSGGRLVLAVSKALKGEASTWLSQIAYEGITWVEFKALFATRFISTETLAGTLIKMSAEKPSEKETLPAFASRLISSLINRWKDVNKEEIAVATVLAHLSQFEPRLQRIAFTTNITSREKLQQELSAFSHLKRKINTTSELSNTTDVKRARMTQVQCYNCGSSHGGSGPAIGGAHGGERRVDVCTVQPPSGTLIHKGELIQFTYDSGAECSLVGESFSSKFSGKRHYNVVAMTGIGKTQAFSTEQILCCVTINGHPLEILLHVLPDSYLQSNVMLGREILNRGFAVNMTATELSFTKVCCVNSISQNSDNTLRLDSITTGVSGENKSKLLDVLNQFSEYFITGLPTTRVNTGELKIKLIDSNRTVQRRPYRMSTEERSIVRERVKELLEANIIRPSCSPFASPALLVKKRDGSDRMCIDYRELNNNTVSDRYPLPLISDQIARLHAANYFSKLDCASGFHLILVSEDAIEMTAFITNDGQYEFLTMPFGLKNAISVFQRAIMNALGDLAHDYVIVYVDDILIVSPDVELGLQRLYTVLEVLTKAGFSLNLKKCSFLKTKVEFLGFEVESGQIKPNRRKVEALTALPPP